MKLENIIYFACGALLGAGVSYFVTRKIERKRADDEIKAYKEYVDKRIAELEGKLEPCDHECEEIELSESEEKSIEELSNRVDRAVDEYNRIRKNIAFQDHMTVEEALETGDEELIEAAEWMERRDEMLSKGEIKGLDGSPLVISQLAYTGEGEGEYTYMPEYQHISLDWYSGDGYLAYGHNCEIDGIEHKQGDLIEKPNFVVGWKWKQHFGDPELFNDTDCVYVRNEILQCDFEIIRDAGSYREIVLGLDLDDDEEEDDNEDAN